MLKPELIETIACFIACPVAWHCFLSAMPNYALRQPFQCILQLYPHVLTRGPRLCLNKIVLEHVPIIRGAMELYSTVELNDWTHPNRSIACVGNNVAVQVNNIKSFDAIELAIRRWHLQLIACKIDVGPEALFAAKDVISMCDLLKSCKSLKLMDICWQRSMHPMEQDALILWICQAKLTQLRIASFMAIALSDENTMRLAAWLESTPVQELIFESVAFSMQSEAFVSHAIRRRVPTLKLLKLAFTSSFARALLNGKNLPPSLPVLEIVGSIETVDIAPSMAAMMAESLSESNLTHCTLSSNHCLHNPEVACPLFGALPSMKNLVYLNLTYNGLDSTACEALAFNLPKIAQLQVLNLENNFLRNVGSAIIATALPQCNNVQTLYLGHNFIGDVGIRAICKAIVGCTQLSTLKLGGNDLTMHGAMLLAKMLVETPQLTHLDVAHNPNIRYDGIMRLLNSIHQVSHQVHLTISALTLPPKQLRKCTSYVDTLSLPVTLLL
ncbi:hypothetical protein THRCLA_06432 [Thraustotheca clavata]|uniref:Uncharacterized protein n=1 Tax=Thraustotheca clavata TaxID=74557 RepID=A0A1V9ZNU2_9STRA|nr:hypothetical protein THRCLA_06432 [Thraustotheca clavata]